MPETSLGRSVRGHSRELLRRIRRWLISAVQKTVEIDYEYSGIRCPCGHRILMKERPTTVKKMKAV